MKPKPIVDYFLTISLEKKIKDLVILVPNKLWFTTKSMGNSENGSLSHFKAHGRNSGQKRILTLKILNIMAKKPLKPLSCLCLLFTCADVN